MNKLSNIPSKMLKQSLEDLEAVMQNPLYGINMCNWHDFFVTENVCEVCHAGAVMANRLEGNRFQNIYPANYKNEISNKLIAIDCIRSGSFKNFFIILDVQKPESIPEHYSNFLDQESIEELSRENLPEYINHICTIIGILEAEGL